MAQFQPYNHFEYGEMLARCLKAINHTDADEHYYRATEVESFSQLTDRLSSAHGMILMAMDGKNYDFGYKNSDSLMVIPQYFFIVAMPADENNTDEIFAAQSQCASVAQQIISRMMYDREYQRNSVITCLDPDSFTLRGYGPLGNNFYGVILGFNLNFGFNYQINKSMWQEV